MRRLALVLVLTLQAAALAVAAVDPFYAGLLRDGSHTYDRGDFASAARDLRLACFGFLEEPPALAECLVRLAAAQAAAGDDSGFADTFRRLAEVEERFGAYAKAQVPAAVRAAFEERATAAIPEATLRSLPAFVPLAELKRAAAGQTGGTGGRGARRAAAAEPGPATAAPAAPGAVAPSPAGAAVPPPEPVAAGAAPAISTAEREKLEAARRLMGAGATSADLKQALALAREVADAHPRLEEAQHLAAEAAYRTSRWGDAATYFQRGGDPGDARPELLFYLAVALWETGDRAGATRAIERALPNLQKTPYVESYAKKILGR